MSKKIKRNVTSFSYSLNKFYQRLTRNKPSIFLVFIILTGFTTFLFGGGLFNLIEEPLNYGGNFVFIYPRLTEQFIMGSIFSMMLYALGIVGLISIYQSTKHAYNPRQANMMLFVGISLLIIAYIILEVTIRVKIGL